jgi:hypothetical protein
LLVDQVSSLSFSDIPFVGVLIPDGIAVPVEKRNAAGSLDRAPFSTLPQVEPAIVALFLAVPAFF